jgi:hypothetical protein
MTRIVTTHYRYKRPLMTVMALALSTSGFAQKTAPGDRVYDLQSEAQGTCPALDWHIVASPSGVLTGMFARPDRKMIAAVSGTILPHVNAERFGRPLSGNPNIQQFSMIASEIGSHYRIANITGIIQPNGWMICGSGRPRGGLQRYQGAPVCLASRLTSVTMTCIVRTAAVVKAGACKRVAGSGRGCRLR